MKLGPKYKIARRLGAPVFEKTQTQKYALSLARKEKSAGRPKAKSEYGQQLIEKQKARFTYYLTEKQFSRYVKESLSASDPAQKLFRTLELRLDNILFRSGLAKTRTQARQMAGHGHATVNGRRVTIPSMQLKEGDVVGVREGSRSSALFHDAAERMRTLAVPAWLKADPDNLTATVAGQPVYASGENVYDLSVVLEFYSR